MLTVKDIMTRSVGTIESKRTIRDAATVMSRAQVGSLIIMDGDKIAGIITEGDISKTLANKANPDKVTVKRVMSRQLVTVSPDLRVEEAAKLMADKKIKKLPVLEGGNLVGIVTQTDIVASSFELVISLKEMVRARYRPADFQP